MHLYDGTQSFKEDFSRALGSHAALYYACDSFVLFFGPTDRYMTAQGEALGIMANK